MKNNILLTIYFKKRWWLDFRLPMSIMVYRAFAREGFLCIYHYNQQADTYEEEYIPQHNIDRFTAKGMAR